MVGMRFDATDAEISPSASPATSSVYAATRTMKPNNEFSALMLMIIVVVGLDMPWVWFLAAFMVWAVDRAGCSGPPTV